MNVSKGLVKMRQMPLFPLVPLLPLGILLGSVALSLYSYRRVRQLQARLDNRANPLGAAPAYPNATANAR